MKYSNMIKLRVETKLCIVGIPAVWAVYKACIWFEALYQVDRVFLYLLFSGFCMSLSMAGAALLAFVVGERLVRRFRLDSLAKRFAGWVMTDDK